MMAYKQFSYSSDVECAVYVYYCVIVVYENI